MNVWIFIPTNGKRKNLAISLMSLLYHLDFFDGVYIHENGVEHTSEDIVVHQMIAFLKAKGKTVLIEYSNLPVKSLTQLRQNFLLKARNLNIKYMLLLDDDAVLGKDCLENLVSTIKLTENFGWVSPVLIYPQSYYPEFENKIYDFWRFLLVPKKVDEEEIIKNKCYMATTTCLLIDVDKSLKLGGFDFSKSLRDFGEDRFFTAKFYNKYDTYVHRGALCYVSHPMKEEGKNWKIPINKLFLNPELSVFLDKKILEYIKNG